MESNLIFPEKVWKQLMAYAKFAPGEMSGLGTIECLQNGAGFAVTEVFLFNQVSNGVNTDLNTDMVALFINQLIRKGKDPNTLKLWFHSHGHGGTFWSREDDATIQGFSYTDFMISIVVNKEQDHLARLDIYRPVRLSLGLPVVFRNDFLGVDLMKLEQEVIRKVKASPIRRIAKIQIPLEVPK